MYGLIISTRMHKDGFTRKRKDGYTRMCKDGFPRKRKYGFTRMRKDGSTRKIRSTIYGLNNLYLSNVHAG